MTALTAEAFFECTYVSLDASFDLVYTFCILHAYYMLVRTRKTHTHTLHVYVCIYVLVDYVFTVG